MNCQAILQFSNIGVAILLLFVLSAFVSLIFRIKAVINVTETLNQGNTTQVKREDIGRGIKRLKLSRYF